MADIRTATMFGLIENTIDDEETLVLIDRFTKQDFKFLQIKAISNAPYFHY